MSETITLNLSAQNIITFGALIAAIVAIIAYFTKAHNWFIKQDQQSEEIAKLKDELQKTSERLKENHDKDISEIKQEQTIIVYGMLACLKGMKEQGCDGPVSEAIDKLDKYLNQKAHS